MRHARGSSSGGAADRATVDLAATHPGAAGDPIGRLGRAALGVSRVVATPFLLAGIALWAAVFVAAASARAIGLAIGGLSDRRPPRGPDR